MKVNIQKICVSALLIAIGLIIPLFSPIRIRLDPASFTLASHVAIFIAMMISPGTAAGVVVGTTLGFFLSSPIVIAMRAATHLIFALAGAFYLKRVPELLGNPLRTRLFSLVIGVIHAAAEVAVVIPFYFNNNLSAGFYDKGFLVSVVLLVGVGSVVHSMVDFEIALAIAKALSKQRGFSLLQAVRPLRQLPQSQKEDGADAVAGHQEEAGLPEMDQRPRHSIAHDRA